MGGVGSCDRLLGRVALLGSWSHVLGGHVLSSGEHSSSQLADGTKFVLFQKPGLHGEAWFDKNKNYSIDCQVRQ